MTLLSLESFRNASFFEGTQVELVQWSLMDLQEQQASRKQCLELNRLMLSSEEKQKCEAVEELVTGQFQLLEVMIGRKLFEQFPEDAFRIFVSGEPRLGLSPLSIVPFVTLTQKQLKELNDRQLALIVRIQILELLSFQCQVHFEGVTPSGLMYEHTLLHTGEAVQVHRAYRVEVPSEAVWDEWYRALLHWRRESELGITESRYHYEHPEVAQMKEACLSLYGEAGLEQALGKLVGSKSGISAQPSKAFSVQTCMEDGVLRHTERTRFLAVMLGAQNPLAPLSYELPKFFQRGSSEALLTSPLLQQFLSLDSSRARHEEVLRWLPHYLA